MLYTLVHERGGASAVRPATGMTKKHVMLKLLTMEVWC